MFFHNKLPQAQFASWIFLAMLAVFVYLLPLHQVVSLTGIGVTLVIGSVLIEANSRRIWLSYKQTYRRHGSKWSQALSEPKEAYNLLNVFVVWPVVFAVGVMAIMSALQLG